MRSPFENIDGAFVPFFGEDITVSTKDGRSGVFPVCVFTDGTADPLTEDMMETDREDINIVFRKCDWPFVKGLVRGDQIMRERNGKKYAVSQAKMDNALGWVVAAREA